MNVTSDPICRTLAIFAHEIREPLASILCAAQKADDPSNDEADYRTSFEVIERQCRYLATLTEAALELGCGDRRSRGRDRRDCRLPRRLEGRLCYRCQLDH
ncbi:MAG: hypothetical protein INR62_03930 [Rhodospirillales bacterium]|nr:hypothetical protein [Acetobacter sp.]